MPTSYTQVTVSETTWETYVVSADSGVFAVYAATMPSASTLTKAIDLEHSYNQVYLSVPSLTSNTAHYIKAAPALTATYRRVKMPPFNHSQAVTYDFGIASAATNCVVPIPSGLRFIKIETSASVDNGANYLIYAAD